LAGAGGSANTAGASSLANGIGAAGMSGPVVTPPRSSGGGCQMVGNSASNSGPTAVLILLLGIVGRSRKRSWAGSGADERRS
jgi:hypothetical protein